jgi:hypothetical protein
LTLSPSLPEEVARHKSGRTQHPFRDERQYRWRHSIRPPLVFLSERAGLLDYVTAAAFQNTHAANPMNESSAGFPNSQLEEFSK